MTGPTELVPFPQRAGALQAARVMLCVAAVAVVVLATDVVPVSGGGNVVAVSTGYLVLSSAAEIARRRTGRRALELVAAMLLVDGVFLLYVTASTGGTSSAVSVLIHLHIVLVTLLGSFTSGVAIASWHALLLMTADRAGWVDGWATRSGQGLVTMIVSYLVVAVATAVAARLNERALQRGREATSTLLELGSALERCGSVAQLALAAAEHLSRWSDTARSTVLVRQGVTWSGAIASPRGVVSARVGGVPAWRHQGSPELHARLDAVRWPQLVAAIPGASNVVIVPLVADGRYVGVAGVECGPLRRTVATDELLQIEQAAERIALSLRAMQLLGELERLAVSDPLTGLPNRRLFTEALDREVRRARRYGAPLALAVLDVDHFKAVNDAHGHLVGDDVLRELAGALRSAVRPESIVARYGGEEFVVLLPDAAHDDALAAAERLRLAAAEVRTVAVTVSIGVAVCADGADGGALLATADTALYQAKALGRNRTVCIDADMASIAMLS